MKNYFCIIILISLILISCESKIKVQDEKSKTESRLDLKEKINLDIRDENYNLKNKSNDVLNIEMGDREVINTNVGIISKKPLTSETKELAELIIDDSSQYSNKFIRFLREYDGVNLIEFNNGVMILNKKDSIVFPSFPKMGKEIKLSGQKKDLEVLLVISRINYTSVKYSLEIIELGSPIENINGIADLSGFFFLGNETDTDDLTHENYFSFGYSNQKDSCFINIRIGNLKDSPEEYLLVKIEKECSDKNRNIGLDKWPTLRGKR